MLSTEDVYYVSNNPKKVSDEINKKLDGTKLPAQSDLAGTATLADVITAHNALLAKLRASGIMS